MVHNIWGERFVARREAAWHGLGTVFPEDTKMSPAQAVIMANCDYEVRKFPAIVRLPNGKNLAAQETALVRCPADIPMLQEDGTYKLVADTESDDYHILGYCSKNYEVVNNLELAIMLEKIGEQYPIETVGALGNGETIFMCFRTGKVRLNGDELEEIELFITVSNNHDGKRALHVMITPIRTVCQNTLILGQQRAMIHAAIPHTVSVKDDAEFHINLLARVRKQQEDMVEEFSAMAKHGINEEQAAAIFARAYPDPKPTRKTVTAKVITEDAKIMAMVQDDRTVAERLLSQIARDGDKIEKAQERMNALRNAAYERFIITGDQNPNIRGTVWAAWQGVTEVESYRGNTSKDTSRSILFGDRAENMGRAYEACRELVGLK